MLVYLVREQLISFSHLVRPSRSCLALDSNRRMKYLYYLKGPYEYAGTVNSFSFQTLSSKRIHRRWFSDSRIRLCTLLIDPSTITARFLGCRLHCGNGTQISRHFRPQKQITRTQQPEVAHCSTGTICQPGPKTTSTSILDSVRLLGRTLIVSRVFFMYIMRQLTSIATCWPRYG